MGGHTYKNCVHDTTVEKKKNRKNKQSVHTHIIINQTSQVIKENKKKKNNVKSVQQNTKKMKKKVEKILYISAHAHCHCCVLYLYCYYYSTNECSERKARKATTKSHKIEYRKS